MKFLDAEASRKIRRGITAHDVQKIMKQKGLI